MVYHCSYFKYVCRWAPKSSRCLGPPKDLISLSESSHFIVINVLLWSIQLPQQHSGFYIIYLKTRLSGLQSMGFLCKLRSTLCIPLPPSRVWEYPLVSTSMSTKLLLTVVSTTSVTGQGRDLPALGMMRCLEGSSWVCVRFSTTSPSSLVENCAPL